MDEVKIIIERDPVATASDDDKNVLEELHQSENMIVDKNNSDPHENVSVKVCDSNSDGKFNIVISNPGVTDNNLYEKSDINPMDTSMMDTIERSGERTSVSENVFQNYNLNNPVSAVVSIDRIGNWDNETNTATDDNRNVSPCVEKTSVQESESSEILKSVLQELSTASAVNRETVKDSSVATIRSPTYRDKNVLLSQLLCGSTASSGKSKEKPTTIMKPPTYKDNKHGKVELYAPDTGPKIYAVKGNIVTQPIITKNLPEAFRALPVHGRAESKAGLENFYRQKIRDYVGYGINDDEFKKLENFCSPEYLRTGKELTMTYSFPTQGSLPADLMTVPKENGPGENLCIVKKLKLRMNKDKQNHYPRKLKYRGLRLLPLTQEDDDQTGEILQPNSTKASNEETDGPLEPGRDLIFRVRFYRPHSYGDRHMKPARHSVFNNDIVLLGRQRLTALRDRIGCPNDIGMRIDMSDNPDTFITESAKRVFPSGFLFINNVFYVDRRRGCLDHSAAIRDWARRRRLGDFPVRDMAVRLDAVLLRLGHPEVYMHQGKCEHLFTFSEARLLGAAEPLRRAAYPAHSAIAQNQSVYCTTCAEFGAKWIVAGCHRVPFDPAFFCETCFKLYLYDRDGNKIGDFKAYSYRGNAVNFLKPIAGNPDAEVDEATDDESGD